MVENTNEFNYDYVNQKLLYLLLIRGCSIVIRPFEYGHKLDGLFELLSSFYIIEEIDMNNITNPAHLEGFFCSYDDNEKKTLILIKNANQDTMKEVMKYPDILFIALEKNQSVDYSEFLHIAVFNKKTKKFSLIVPKNQISANSLAYKWINDKIITKLRSTGVLEVNEYLCQIYEKIASLFDLLPAISKSLYQYFCAELTSQEQKVVTAICEHYYKVTLPIYTKKLIIPKKQENSEIKEVEIREEVDIVKEEEPKIELIHERIEKKKIENNENVDEIQINQEIWELITNGKDSSGYNAFSLALANITTNSNEIFSTPEKKYYYLRNNEWKKQIPFGFFKILFLFFVQEEIKNDKVPKTALNRYLNDKHDLLIDICSMIASPEFKRMDPTQFADDEILKSYLKKESVVSNVLPVNTPQKSISPKEIEKMFGKESESNNRYNRDDFNLRYQKNLAKLKEEYGEREINSELTRKLRKKTKELHNQISTLFQD